MSKKIENSGYARYAELESMFMESMYDQKTLTASRRDEMSVTFEKSCLNYKIPIADLCDNRDLGLFDDWRENAVERTRFCQTNNFEQLKAWMTFRHAFANCFLKIENSDETEPKPELAGLLSEAESALSKGQKYVKSTVSAPKDVPLRLDTEWQSVEELKYNESLPATVGMVAGLKFLKTVDLTEIIATMTSVLEMILNPILKDTSAFYTQDVNSEAFYSLPSKIGTIRLALELINCIILQLKQISLSQKSLKKAAAGKRNAVHSSNLEKLIPFTSKLELILTNFVSSLPQVPVYDLEKCQNFDAEYARKTVLHKLSTNLQSNINRYRILVEKMLKSIEKSKL